MAVVGALTFLAFALRLANLDQSLYGDEVLTFDIVSRHGLLAMLREVHDTSVTPPLHYVLAWLAVQVGEPTTWVRIPSLLLGTATVPLTYLLGRRTVGAVPGLVAAALVALSPFAIFYSVEARAYATLIFLVALSTLALLTALRTRRTRWWVVYALSAALVLYTHYTGVFALGAQAAWAFWTQRERLRELAVVHAAILVAYLPWIPSFLNQRGNEGIGAIEALAPPIDAHAVGTALLSVLPGGPFVPLREVPGRAALTVIGVTVGLGLVAVCVRLVRRLRAERPAGLSRPQALLVLLALATPVGIVLYSLAGTDLLLSRNLGASLSATALLVAWVLVSLGRLPGAIAVTAVLAAVGVGTLDALGDEHRRPAAKEAARFVDERARRGDALVYSTVAGDLHVYRDRALKTFLGVDEARGWRYADARGGKVLMVRPYFGFFAYAPEPPAGLARRYALRSQRVYEGFQPLAVLIYSP
jgi:4-amino-4-deoxy-L-arabinose transferase-like glycosyltransferase